MDMKCVEIYAKVNLNTRVNMENFFIMITSSILFTISVCILLGFRSIVDGSNNHEKFVASIVNLVLITIVLYCV